MAAHNKIVFDLETQKAFDEVANKTHLLKISVIGVYSFAEDKYYCFTEDQIYRVGEMFQEADQIIGFNIKHFDYEVLRPYLNYDPHTLPTVDIMVEIEKLIGHRIRLDNVAKTTLGVGKNGDGLEAIRLYRQGRIDDLKKYCTNDVKITKDVYNYAQQYGKLLYKDYFDTREIKIAFPEPEIRKPVIRQTSLF